MVDGRLMYILCFVFFKQKTAYELRISDWSSDVCSSDLALSHRKQVYEPIFRPSLSRQYDPPVVVSRPHWQRCFPGSNDQLRIARQIAAAHPKLFQLRIGKFDLHVLTVMVYLRPCRGQRHVPEQQPSPRPCPPLRGLGHALLKGACPDNPPTLSARPQKG